MRSGRALASDSFLSPPSADGRPPLAEIYGAFEALRKAGWTEAQIGTQPAPSGGLLPIRAYFNAGEVDAVLIGGIHGREPAGALALARCVPCFAERGREMRLLVMPLMNPWGYLHHQRYGPSGRSVTDCDHWLGRSAAPACDEAAAITEFVVNGIRIRRGASALDLHEDPVYEAPGYRLDGRGSYLYFNGSGAPDHPASRRVRDFLQGSALPLVREGVTRFGDRIAEGIIRGEPDGSIDELLERKLGCNPVITVENVLQAADSPPLEERVSVYAGVIEAFLGPRRK